MGPEFLVYTKNSKSSSLKKKESEASEKQGDG